MLTIGEVFTSSLEWSRKMLDLADETRAYRRLLSRNRRAAATVQTSFGSLPPFTSSTASPDFDRHHCCFCADVNGGIELLADNIAECRKRTC